MSLFILLIVIECGESYNFSGLDFADGFEVEMWLVLVLRLGVFEVFCSFHLCNLFMADLDTLCSDASLIALSNLDGLFCNGCFFDSLGL